jgi:hypothetical protein
MAEDVIEPTPEQEHLNALGAEVEALRGDLSRVSGELHDTRILAQVLADKLAETQKESLDTRVMASKLNIENQNLRQALNSTTS